MCKQGCGVGGGRVGKDTIKRQLGQGVGKRKMIWPAASTYDINQALGSQESPPMLPGSRGSGLRHCQSQSVSAQTFPAMVESRTDILTVHMKWLVNRNPPPVLKFCLKGQTPWRE